MPKPPVVSSVVAPLVPRLGNDPRANVGVLRLALGALGLGMTAFAVIACVLTPPMGNASGGGTGAGAGNGALLTTAPMMLAALMVQAIAVTAGWFAVGRKILAVQARKAWANRADDEAGMAAVVRIYVTRGIVLGALVEGVGLFGAVIMLTTKNPLGLAATAGALVVMAMVFPTNARVGAFVNAATRNDATA